MMEIYTWLPIEYRDFLMMVGIAAAITAFVPCVFAKKRLWWTFGAALVLVAYGATMFIPSWVALRHLPMMVPVMLFSLVVVFELFARAAPEVRKKSQVSLSVQLSVFTFFGILFAGRQVMQNDRQIWLDDSSVTGFGNTATTLARADARVRKVGDPRSPSVKITDNRKSIFIAGDYRGPTGRVFSESELADRLAQWTGRPSEQNLDRPGTNLRVSSLE